MEKTFSKMEELTDNLKEYIQNRIDQAKLGAAEKGSGLLSNTMSGVVLLFTLLLVCIFAGLALGFALAAWTGMSWLGFAVVAVLYGVIGILTWAVWRKKIRERIMNKFINELFSGDEKD